MNEFDLKSVFDITTTLGYYLHEQATSDGFPDHDGNLLKFKEVADTLGLRASVAAIDKAISVLSLAHAGVSSERISSEDTRRVLSHAIKRFSEDCEELRFLFVVRDRVPYLDGSTYDWSSIIETVPEATAYVTEAGRSYALGMPTASVYFSLCAMELGIRWIGERFEGIDKPDLNYATWGKWSESIKNYLNTRRVSKTTGKSYTVRRKYADDLKSLNADIMITKIAWRDKTMHPTATFSDGDAKKIYGAMHSFLSTVEKLKRASTSK